MTSFTCQTSHDILEISEVCNNYLAAALIEGALEYLEAGGIDPEDEALENLEEGGRDVPGDLTLLLLATESRLTSQEFASIMIFQTDLV